MSEQPTKDQFVSNRKLTLEEAQAKANEAACIVMARFPGSYIHSPDYLTYAVMSKENQKIATIHVESLQ